MSRGGKRDNAGRKSGWANLETKLIRIPVAIEADLMAIAKKLDQGEYVEIEAKSKEIETVTESKLDFVTVSIKEIVDRYKDEYLKTTPKNTRWDNARKLLSELELILYGETSLESVTKSKPKKKETEIVETIQDESVTVSENNNIELVTESKSYEIEQIELIPSTQQIKLEPLKQGELVTRLKVSPRSFFNHKKNLQEWSKSKDPDKVAWEYREDTKKYHPLN